MSNFTRAVLISVSCAMATVILCAGLICGAVWIVWTFEWVAPTFIGIYVFMLISLFIAKSFYPDVKKWVNKKWPDNA